MSELPEAYTYTGPWINWSRGPIRGATITLTQRQGGLLISFLGIFVTFTGATTWRILSYLLHQSRARQGNRNGFHHHLQLVLRNNSTSGAALWQMIQIFWAWRRLASRSFIRSLPFILLALCNMTLFTLAGIFSSEVTKTPGNETLLLSPGCGFQVPVKPSMLDPSSLYALDTNGTLVASTYANACYGDSFNNFQCKQFVKPRLNWTTKPNVTCPVQADVCLEGPTSAFEMDTGMLDTRDDLGINTRDADRLQYRKKTTCSVLNGTAYAKTRNVTQGDGSNRLFVDYYFGGNGSAEDPLFTYRAEDRLSSSYALTPFEFLARLPDEPADGLVPIPEIKRDDADVTIMFLAANSVQYTAPVHDPWFQATDKENDTRLGELYNADYVIKTLACTDQYQYCNPRINSCTPLTGRFIVNNDVETLGLSKLQEAIFIDLSYAMYLQSTYYAVHSRGPAALRASETLQGSDLIHEGMPPDQWVTEVNHWFALNLARLQQLMVDYATGPAYPKEGYERVKGDKDLCQRQKVRSANGYISFSTLGVTIIILVGVVLMIVALCIDSVVGYAMKRFGFKDYKRRQWAQDEKLQLLRLAYEGVGQGTWTGETDAVPVTTRDQALGELEACFRATDGDVKQAEDETEACMKPQDRASGGEEYAHAAPQVYTGGQSNSTFQYEGKGWGEPTVR